MCLGFTFGHDNDLKHTAETTLKWLRDKSLTVLQKPRQSFKPHCISVRDLKNAVHRYFLSCLTELERICQDEWNKLPKFSWAKPIETESCNCCQGASTKYRIKGLNTYINERLQFLIFFIFDFYEIAKMSKNMFSLCNYGLMSVDRWAKMPIVSIQN